MAESKGESMAVVAYVPFVAADFRRGEDGKWHATVVPLPSDHVELIEVSITLKPGVRLRDVGRSCAHAAVDAVVEAAGG